MLEGSCLCGAVRYQLNTELGRVFFCHCSKCRKANGSAFAANTVVNKADFSLLSGEEMLNEFESSPGVYRVFCRQCASPIFSRRKAQPDQIRLRIGSLDSPVQDVQISHIFVDSKAPWFEICDNLPQFPAYPAL